MCENFNNAKDGVEAGQSIWGDKQPKGVKKKSNKGLKRTSNKVEPRIVKMGSTIQRGVSGACSPR